MKKKKTLLKRLEKKAIALLMPLVRQLVHYWLHTLRFDHTTLAQLAQLAHKPEDKVVLICIHEEILPLIAYAGILTHKHNASFVGLTSLHRDSDTTTWLLRRNKLQVVRGSTTKGGREALNQLIQSMNQSTNKSAAIAVDGPQGPRRIVKPGAILLAKRKSLPIYIVRFHYSGWRMKKSWDKNLLPKPYSKITVSYSQAIEVSRKSNVKDVQQQLQQIISEMD